MMNMQKYSKLSQMSHAEHRTYIKEIFDTIPKRYDFLNHLLSFLQDIRWRRFAINQTQFFFKNRLLDLATGTGDLALETIRKNPNIQVIGMDFSSAMLLHCNQKIRTRSLYDRIQLVKGDALALPFINNSFDAVVIGFGIRNIPDKVQALKEMQRVVTPGGQIMVLEMGLPRPRLCRFFYLFYLKYFIPFIALMFSPNPKAYSYLADSIQRFPSPQNFVKLMHQAGLKKTKIHALTFGITYLFMGRVKS